MTMHHDPRPEGQRCVAFDTENCGLFYFGGVCVCVWGGGGGSGFLSLSFLSFFCFSLPLHTSLYLPLRLPCLSMFLSYLVHVAFKNNSISVSLYACRPPTPKPISPRSDNLYLLLFLFFLFLLSLSFISSYCFLWMSVLNFHILLLSRHILFCQSSYYCVVLFIMRYISLSIF